MLLTSAGAAAPNGASTAYVDKKFAGIQSQIDAIKMTPVVAHPLGSCYGGGVVFYVNLDQTAQPGHRGLIVAPSDAGSTSISGCEPGAPGLPAVVCAWNPLGAGTPTVTYTATNPFLYFTGESNTTNISPGTSPGTGGTWSAVDAVSYYNTTNPAPACAGCTSWYLPSQDELTLLYYQSNNITNFGAACPTGYSAPVLANYWSSSQQSDDSSRAWEVDFGAGYVGNLPNIGPLGVRPVRAF